MSGSVCRDVELLCSGDSQQVKVKCHGSDCDFLSTGHLPPYCFRQIIIDPFVCYEFILVCKSLSDHIHALVSVV